MSVEAEHLCSMSIITVKVVPKDHVSHLSSHAFQPVVVGTEQSTVWPPVGEFPGFNKIKTDTESQEHVV